MSKESNHSIIGVDIVNLQSKVLSAGFDIIKTENLYSFAGERGYSLGKGQ